MLPHPVPVPVELRLKPWATRHVRLAGPCQGSHCAHWSDGCGLGRQVTSGHVEESVEAGPCQIRDQCRWFSENGLEVCRRCPKLMRENA